MSEDSPTIGDLRASLGSLALPIDDLARMQMLRASRDEQRAGPVKMPHLDAPPPIVLEYQPLALPPMMAPIDAPIPPGELRAEPYRERGR